MWSRARFSGLGLAVLVAVLLASPSASAAPRAITGNLNQPGYTVIALAANGEARAVSPQGRSFTLVPPAETVTLQLRAPDGTYAGPIVVEETANNVKRARAQVTRAKRKVKRAKRKAKRAQRKAKHASGKQATSKARKRLRKARRRLARARRRLKKARRLLREARRQEAERPSRALLGVRAGAPLGEVVVNSAAGYALARGLQGRAWETWVDTERRAQATNGVPIGAGNFGRVRSDGTDGAAIGDLDRDGVPSSLDIDDDGDLILDSLDRSQAARAAQAQVGDNTLFVSQLTMDLPQTANANAPGSTDQQIEAAFTNSGQGALLMIGIPPAASAELDCAGDPTADPPRPGLVYCSRGGTGRLFELGVPNSELPRFPECCDADNDGFGTLAPPAGAGPGAMFLVHGATTAQFKTGDVVIKRLNDADGVEIGAFSHTLQYVFATVPALVSYQDTTMAAPATLTYPYGPGAQEQPVSAPPGEDVVVRLTLWRPQRSPIADEACLADDPPCRWVDIGGLGYSVGVENEGPCPQTAFSTQDANLSPTPPPPVGAPGAGGFTDLATDGSANPANTLTFTVNLSQCSTTPWNPDETRRIHFVAAPPTGGSLGGAGGVAQQIVEFKRL